MSGWRAGLLGSLLARGLPNASGSSEVGPDHEVNEDHFACPDSVDPPLLAERGYLYVVADGVGGHAAGAEASALAVNTVVEAYYSIDWDGPRSTLTRAVEQANNTVFSQGQGRSIARMGSTVVAALVMNRFVYVAHVGDSRAYLVRRGRIRALTQDHSLVGELFARGALTPEEAANHPQRNVLSRSLGAGADVEVETKLESLHAGDRLVLVSDGVTKVVSDDDLCATVAAAPTAEAASQAVLAQARHRGLQDDTTVVVIAPKGWQVHLGSMLRAALRSTGARAALGGTLLAVVVLVLLAWRVGSASDDAAAVAGKPKALPGMRPAEAHAAAVEMHVSNSAANDVPSGDSFPEPRDLPWGRLDVEDAAAARIAAPTAAVSRPTFRLAMVEGWRSGDLNGDGRIDERDVGFLRVLRHFHRGVGVAVGSFGDASLNGRIDFNDTVILALRMAQREGP